MWLLKRRLLKASLSFCCFALIGWLWIWSCQEGSFVAWIADVWKLNLLLHFSSNLCISLSQGQVGHWHPASRGLAHQREATVWKLQSPVQTWIRPGAAWNHLWHRQHWEGACMCVCAPAYLSVCAWVYDKLVGFIRVWISVGLLILNGSILLSRIYEMKGARMNST